MRKFACFFLVLSLLIPTPVFAGSMTANGYFYKPSYGEKGPAGYSYYNAALDATDVVLKAMHDGFNALAAWASTDNVVTLITATPTYVDGDTFTLPGDYTSRFSAGKVVQAQVAAGMVYSTVASSSYVAPTTTVNLNDAVLTDPITRVYVVTTRDGLWPNGPGYVVSRDYGTDRAALEAADAVAVLAGKELRITYPHAIDDDVTLAAPKVTIQPDAVLAVSTTKTLTINGSINAGPYQIFTCTGTGAVAFGAGAVDYIKPEWWGANATTDSAAAVNAALTAAATNKNTVQFSGWYRCDSTVNIPLGPNIAGVGMYACGIDSYANDHAVTGTGKISQQYFMNFGVTQANNTNAGANLNIMDLQYGANFSTFINLSLIGQAATTLNGFVLRGTHPTAGANTNQFSNTLLNVRTGTADTEIAGAGIKLLGTSTVNTRCNNNHIISCCPGGFSTGIYVFGYNNTITMPVFNGLQSASCIEFADDASGGGTANNVVSAPYFDTAVTGDKILITAAYDNATMGFNKWVSIHDVHPQTFLSTDVTIAGAGAARVRFVLDGVHYYPSITPNGFDAPLGTVVNCATAGYTFIKVGTGTDAYQDWMRLMRSWSGVVSVDVGNVAAGSELEFDITPSTVPDTALTVTTVNNIALADGLIIRRVYFDGSVIKVKLYNYTGGDIDPAAQNWRYVITEY